MHVLPSGFQKIRYYGFLNNRTKSESLRIIFKLQGYQKFKQRYTGLSVAELLKEVWNYDILILSILVYTFFSRMFDLMLPPVAKHSIVVA